MLVWELPTPREFLFQPVSTTRWEGCPGQVKIAAGTGQNKLPASYYPPSVPLLCPFQSCNLYPRCLSHSRNGFIPEVITVNDCTIFIYFYPRHIYINLPIPEMYAQLRSDVATGGSFVQQTLIVPLPRVWLSLCHTAPFLYWLLIVLVDKYESWSENDLHRREWSAQFVFLYLADMQ